MRGEEGKESSNRNQKPWRKRPQVHKEFERKEGKRETAKGIEREALVQESSKGNGLGMKRARLELWEEEVRGERGGKGRSESLLESDFRSEFA